MDAAALATNIVDLSSERKKRNGTQHNIIISGNIGLSYQYAHHAVEDEQEHGRPPHEYEI